MGKGSSGKKCAKWWSGVTGVTWRGATSREMLAWSYVYWDGGVKSRLGSIGLDSRERVVQWRGGNACQSTMSLSWNNVHEANPSEGGRGWSTWSTVEQCEYFESAAKYFSQPSLPFFISLPHSRPNLPSVLFPPLPTSFLRSPSFPSTPSALLPPFTLPSLSNPLQRASSRNQQL